MHLRFEGQPLIRISSNACMPFYLQGGLYCGGSAKMVEKALGVEGDDILYVGDHIYTDAGGFTVWRGSVCAVHAFRNAVTHRTCRRRSSS